MQVEYFPTNESLQGLAVLTKLPVVEQQGQFLDGKGQQTGVQYVRLLAPDRAELQIYNTELGLLLSDNGQSVQAQEQDQTKQLQEIFTLISQNDPQLTNRTVVGGTFNNTSDSDLYQYMIQSGFIDPFAGLSAEKANTLRIVNKPDTRFDYLFLRHITTRSLGVTNIQQSTHNMAIVEIGLLQSSG